VAAHRYRRRRRHGESGQIGGIEVLPFGVLIFVAGSLLLANAWAVIDAKMAATSAAREATRAYVEAPDQVSAEAAADSAARDSIAGHGRDPRKLRLDNNDPAFVRCARVVYEARYTVPALSLPFIGGFGHGFTVVGRHAEIIDPFTSGLPAADLCGF
jgi:hypothetical protein